MHCALLALPSNLALLCMRFEPRTSLCFLPLRLKAQEWQVVTALLEPRMSSKATKLVIRFKGPGALELDWVSLVPAVNLASPAETSGSNAGNARNAAAGTSKHTDSAAVSGTAAGAAGDAGVAVASSSPFNAASLYPYNRRLLSGLSELRPCFLRFPGAGSSASGLRWKGTVGLGDERPGHMSSHGPAYWCVQHAMTHCRVGWHITAVWCCGAAGCVPHRVAECRVAFIMISLGVRRHDACQPNGACRIADLHHPHQHFQRKAKPSRPSFPTVPWMPRVTEVPRSGHMLKLHCCGIVPQVD